MIEPAEALKKILEHVKPRPSVRVKLEEAFRYFIAKPVLAPYDHPFFDQSAMDGYALRFEELKPGQRLRVSGESGAGTTEVPEPAAGEAVRIFTGAPVPESADTVIMQEHVHREGNEITIEKMPSKKGLHIRRKGEQIKKGSIALEAGMRLDAPAIGFLASIGVEHVEICRPPRTVIINTGSEFLEEGEALKKGKIFESNGIMLQEALRHENIKAEKKRVRDSKSMMREMIRLEADRSDLLLITGGVSVGEYDFTPDALQAAGFRIVFHKVKQKPGKPLLFAVREDCIAFGLPGNPRSVLSSFYLYVLPALHRLCGASKPGLMQTGFPLQEEVVNPGDRTLYLSGTVKDGKAQPLSGQGSHMLQSFSLAEILIEIPPGGKKEGDLVKIFFLPQ